MKISDDSNLLGSAPLGSEKISGGGAFKYMQREFLSFITDVESLARQTAVLSADELSAMRQQLVRRVGQAKVVADESAKKAAAALEQQATHAVNFANHQLHQRPWQILGVSAAIIAAIAFMMKHRSSDKG